MSLDRSAFVQNFLAELLENIEHVDASIISLKKDPQDEEELTSILRALHTIKGSSRMLKFQTMERIAHGLENVFKGIKEGRYPVSSEIVKLVFLTTDVLRSGAEAIGRTGEDQSPPEELLSVYEHAYANEPYSTEHINPPASGATAHPTTPAQTQPNVHTSQQMPGDGSAQTQTRSAAAEADDASLSATGLSTVAAAPASLGKDGSRRTDGESTGASIQQESIRIDVRRVDEIIGLLNGLIIRQFQLKGQNDKLAALEDEVQDIEGLFRSSDVSAESHAKAAACVRRVSNFRKSLQDELTQIEAGTFEIQRDLISLRMLPMELALGGLAKMVEETAIQQGKEIDFSVQGADTLVDKTVLEKIQDPIIHIVRNAIDHGVESPTTRERSGKPRTATISVSCSSENGHIIVRIRDDGVGVDYARVRERVAELYPHLHEELAGMDEASLNGFLFRPGFSTREEVTELSGRGMGLDIVRANVDKIKGKISLSSERGQGTAVTLTLPFSLATVQGFFVTSAEKKFLIPAGFVKEILVSRQLEGVELPDRKAIKLRNTIIPEYFLSDVVGVDAEVHGEGRFTLVVDSLGESFGIVVDSVEQFATLVYRPLPASLAALRAVQGIVFDERYQIVTVLFVPELINRFKRIKVIDAKKRFAPRRQEYRHILVVDDSLTTREIEKSILELENYNVETAVDGIDALAKLRERYYHLVITDVTMPRMDGCTLVENLRKDEKYRDTPIIVISAVEDPPTRDRFAALGVSSYIVKSDFDRGDLVVEVQRLLG